MEERRRRVETRTYVDGNTVRKLETVPDYRREREERQQREIRRHNEHTARRNRERAMRMNLGYVMFLAVAAFIVAMVSVTYIQLQADMTARMKRIAALESQVANLKADNDAAIKRISTSVNLDEIKDKAINQLGMVYAGKDQIVYYTVEDDDYMDQYDEIPQQ